MTGYYSAIKTASFPNGIQFKEGVLEVTDEQFTELKENEEFMRHFKKDEISVWKAPVKAPTMKSVMAENKDLKAMVALQQKQIAELTK